LGAVSKISTCLGGGRGIELLVLLLPLPLVPLVELELLVLLGGIFDEELDGFDALRLNPAEAEVAKRASKTVVARYFISNFIFLYFYKYLISF
jgi:hypothetical protein